MLLELALLSHKDLSMAQKKSLLRYARIVGFIRMYTEVQRVESESSLQVILIFSMNQI